MIEIVNDVICHIAEPNLRQFSVLKSSGWRVAQFVTSTRPQRRRGGHYRALI
jgi:hypothetical protein